jgi:hypothetical protein
MESFTLKTSRNQVALLNKHAKALGCSKAAVVRDLIDKHLSKEKRPSLYQLAKDLCGSVRGPKNLSTRPLIGY